MASVGIDANKRGEIFAAIAGILHLGNVDFEAADSVDSEGVNVAASGASQAALTAAAKQLGLQVEDLLTAVTKQNMHVDKQVIVKQLTHVQAIEKRDSLARIIYSALFNWLVDKINYSITPVDKVGLMTPPSFSYKIHSIGPLIFSYVTPPCNMNPYLGINPFILSSITLLIISTLV